MQAPVIVMNDASTRQTGRKAQTSNITAAKVPLSQFGGSANVGCRGRDSNVSWSEGDVENAARSDGRDSLN
jgi:hypothetical protein